jgi:DNA polymerase III subunit epsilon
MPQAVACRPAVGPPPSAGHRAGGIMDWRTPEVNLRLLWLWTAPSTTNLRASARRWVLRLSLQRPLAVLDIEATGTSPRSDRIVEICLVKVMPDGTRTVNTLRVNPGIPIPIEAQRVHGISDADVASCPSFAAIAPRLLDLLDGCDLCGFNAARFDIPMLAEEFLRAGLNFDADARRVLDPQRIFHRKEPRDLAAAVEFYCGHTHAGAHGAKADALATLDVLEAQLTRYPDLPDDVAALDEYCNPKQPDWVDRTGRLRWEGGVVAVNFGRRKGTPLRVLIENDPGLIRWMLRGDFPADFRRIVEEAVAGRWPPPQAHGR